MLIRPVTLEDHDALLTIAKHAGYGMTSLPQDAEVLKTKIMRSERSFAGNPHREHEHRFLFVLEDTDTGKIVGSTGLESHVGLSSPFYSYKLSKIVQANRELNIYTLNKVLHMVNDYTGASEIGSLFLLEDYRRDGLGRFLSRCRFLMMAEFSELFDDIVIAEMRGVHDDDGNSPFYDHLARHFFQMPFREADYINATKGGQFIADLMPKYPVYVELLAKEAQEVVGVVNTASKPALKLLEREGFCYSGYVDIFDAGPTVKAERSQIATIRASNKLIISDIAAEPLDADKFIISSTILADLRMVMEPAIIRDGKITIDKQTAVKLQVKRGDALRVVAA